MTLSITKNYVYNVLLQITNILIPFITTPYISRVLDPKGIGIVAFTGSVVSYFVLFTTFGTVLYGSRAIAYTRKNVEDLRRTFWNILYVKLFLGALGSVAYVFFILFYTTQYRTIYYIQYISLLSSIIDITYFFQGVEEFGKITTRGVLVRIISTIAIFIFVRKESDFVMYMAISLVGNFIGQLIMWFHLPKCVRSAVSFNLKNFREHFIGSWKLFVPMIAIQVYVVLDKTMLGLLTDETQVGYYEMSQKLVKIALSIITALAPVMMARISYLKSTQRLELFNEYAVQVFDFITYAACLLIALFFATMSDFVPVFFGPKFLDVYELILVGSFLILIIGWNNFFGIQVMISMHMERHFTEAVILGAISNFSMNLVLIPRFGALGASIASVGAETIVTAYEIFKLRGMLPLKEMFSRIYAHILSAAIALVSAKSISYMLGWNSVKAIVLNTILVSVLYISVEAVFKSRINAIVFDKFNLVTERILSVLKK